MSGKVKAIQAKFSGDENTKKRCRDTVLAESIEIIYKTVTFLLISNPKKSSAARGWIAGLNKTVSQVFSFFVHIVLSLNSGRFLLLFFNDDVQKKENIILALALAFYNFYVTCSILHRLFCKNGFIQLRECLLELELNLKDERKLIQLNQILKITVIAQLIMYPLFSTVVMSLLIFASKENSVLKIYFSYPIPVQGVANLTVSMFSIVFYTVGATWPQVIGIIAIWLMVFLRTEFDCLAESFRRYFPQVDTNQETNSSVTERSSRIFQTCKAHHNLCDALDLVNFLCRAYLGFSYTVTIAHICLLTYGIIHRPMNIFEFGYLVFIAIYTVSGAFLYLKEAIRLNLSAHQLANDFYAIDLRQLSTEAALKVSIFLTRLTSSSIGISVAGLFVIDRSTIVMLMGTLLTYLIVVIQTKSPENLPLNNNNTAQGTLRC